jgi:hypothetical protein
VVGLVILATAGLLVRAAIAAPFAVDDVFIFLRYARNLADHGVYGFYPGAGWPRVEGTSSPAWTLALAACWRIGFRGIGPAKVLSLVSALLVPGVAAVAVRGEGRESAFFAAIPAAALALDADLAAWASSGMDTALWTLACVACVALAAHRRTGEAALAAGTLAWVRPEGPLFAAAAVAALARDRRSAVVLGALAAAPLAVLTVARLGYFHDVVPNTFWAKMHAAPDGRDYSGLGYLASALERRPLLLLVLPAAAWPARHLDGARVALALLAASFVFVLVAGGDWMPDRRLLVVALPLGGVAAAIGVSRMRSAPFAVAACLALIAEAALTTDHAIDQTWRTHEWLDQRVTREGLRVRARDPYPLDWMPTHLLHVVAPFVAPGDAVAHVDVGELPYVMGDVAFLDGFGLVDRVAGHAAFTPHHAGARAAAREDFFARRPAAAIIVYDESTARPFAPAQDAVIEDARFAAGWREIDRVATWGNHPCVTYARRDVVAADPTVAEQRIHRWLAAVPDVAPAF